jgi:uncharacterized RDD family membrane protein YckC
MEGGNLTWYYARGDERMGPVDDGQFGELVSTGVIGGDTLVWREGMADWAAYRSLAPAQPAATAGVEAPESILGETPGMRCAECGRPFPVEELLAYENVHVCAECKPFFFQRLREGGRLPNQLRYAGFWVRFGARFIDGIIILGVYLVLSLIVGLLAAGLVDSTGGEPVAPGIVLLLVNLNSLFSLVFGAVYDVYLIGKYAATPGKMAFGLKVVMSDGGPVSYGRALGRYFATFLSQLTLYIGYIIAAFDEEKRALHDHICDTRVVYK